MSVPTISSHDFDVRRGEITAELMEAAMNVGFFTLSDHGIPAEEIQAAFDMSAKFFALPDGVKAKTPLNGKNAGWEKNAQVRPSTGTADQKESMQLQFARMEGLWPADEDIVGFRDFAESFMRRVRDLSVRVMECFADGLGLPLDTFTTGTVDPGVGDSQSVLRLSHYHSTEGKSFGDNFWRAGAHADFDVLTLLFQRDGEGGSEVCPGRDVVGDFGMGNTWSPVEARQDRIVCNIGDQLMRWSDDRLKSTYHRVRLPRGDEPRRARYCMAFFNQARSDTVIQGPRKKYPPITGGEFIADAMARNRMQSAESARQSALSDAQTVASEVHFVPDHMRRQVVTA